jgi:DNA polymerase-3 subunit beta
MKLQIERSSFMKSWQIAERATSTKSTINSLAGIFCRANKNSSQVTLEATDLKTSVKCTASGVVVEEEGDIVFPIKVVGELFKKTPTATFSVHINKEGRGTLIAGRNRYRFTTYSPEEFPNLPSSESADLFCDIKVSELVRILTEGTVAGSVGEEFPKYLGSALVQLKQGEVRVVSTDGRRLSLSKCVVEEYGEDSEMLLPLTGLKELLRIASNSGDDVSVRIMIDNSLAYFQMDGIEFSIRRVESSFPNYEKILNPQTTSGMQLSRSDLISALERVDVVVRDFSRMVLMKMSPDGDLTLSGRAPEIGEAREILDALIDGEPLVRAFNVGYLIDGLKAFQGERVHLTFNGPEGQMTMLRPNQDDFLYMLMPIKLTESDISSMNDESMNEEDMEGEVSE